MREFTDAPARRSSSPLLIGLVGPSGSGKTFSALRLASGMQRVFGGDTFVIDTEAGRALHYAEMFRFMHVPFSPPHGPLDYRDAIRHCMDRGARVIVVDSMTHEHSGEGGVLWQSEQLLSRYGDDESARNRNLARSFIEPKRQRKALINSIIQIGASCAFIFCYRAHERLDFRRKDQRGNPREMGFQPETTSPLMYEMTQQFLLPPGADGHPRMHSELEDERRLIKCPAQFRDWFRDGIQLDESLGERFARWSVGDAGNFDVSAAVARLDACATLDELASCFREYASRRVEIGDAGMARIVEAKDRRKVELQRKPVEA